MSNLLETGAEWIEGQRSQHLSAEVTYSGVRSGSDATLAVLIAATVGRTEFEVQDSNGFLTRSESRDFLVAAADLILAGATPTLPIAGDKIIESVASGGREYEVSAPPGLPVWRYSDPYRNTLRIHTIYLG